MDPGAKPFRFKSWPSTINYLILSKLLNLLILQFFHLLSGNDNSVLDMVCKNHIS